MRSQFRYFNSSPEVIRLVVMMYVRYPLSLRNVEDLLAERGIDISHETIRFWWNRSGPLFAAEIRKKRVAHLRHCQSKFYTACSRSRAGWTSTVFAHESPTCSAGSDAENRLYLFALTVRSRDPDHSVLMRSGGENCLASRSPRLTASRRPVSVCLTNCQM
jgi:hypothetical protein